MCRVQVEEKLLKVVPNESFTKVDCHHWLIFAWPLYLARPKTRCGSRLIEDSANTKQKVDI